MCSVNYHNDYQVQHMMTVLACMYQRVTGAYMLQRFIYTVYVYQTCRLTLLHNTQYVKLAARSPKRVDELRAFFKPRSIYYEQLLHWIHTATQLLASYYSCDEVLHYTGAWVAVRLCHLTDGISSRPHVSNLEIHAVSKQVTFYCAQLYL